MRIYIKLLEEYLGEYLHDFGAGKRFLSTQKAININFLIDITDFIKIKAFCTSKDANNEVKRQANIARKQSQHI